jgi:hypothetical protein
MSYGILMQFDDNLDNDGLFGDAYKSPSIVSGTAIYTTSDNGKAFDVGSAVVDVGTSSNYLGLPEPFNLNLNIKVDSDATDGVILACDELDGDAPVWVISLIDTASTPKIEFRSWNYAGNASALPTIAVPSGNGWNSFNFSNSSSTLYYRVNGGSLSSNTTYATPTNWTSGGLFQVSIGRSQYGSTPSSNPLSTTSTATGVHLDWIAAAFGYEGYSVSTNTDTSVRSETPEGTDLFLENEPLPEFGTPTKTTNSNNAIGQLPVAGGGETQKEFWS